MAKISPVSIKYMITASFRSEGPLEKPDVIGALFGQTEGLLGTDLEMRELQKEGKIGRIEVDLETVDGKSVGKIEVPTALDKSETALIAASLETIDRIGPTEAEITVESIKDVREDKRRVIADRAKALLEGLNSGDGAGELAKSLKEETRAAKIQEYGEEKLPAGDISGNEIVVVEGRADVVNLLKNRVNNVIGMNGTKLPKEIAVLGKDKEITLFIDGDRGGKLIANNVISNANVAYVAIAPDGKEVEELTGKEILIALRRKIKTSEYLRKNGNSVYNGNSSNGSSEDKVEVEEEEIEFEGDIKEAVKKKFDSIKGTKSAVLVDGKFDVIRKVSAREVARSVGHSRNKIFAVIIDGSATKSIIQSCEEKSVKHLAATNFSDSSDKLNMISL
jgi:DNA primase